MGPACSRENTLDRRGRVSGVSGVPVYLHIYSVGTSRGVQLANSVLKNLGTGAFHCGVEVFGCEWSYSDIDLAPGAHPETTGVFSSTPRCCDGHVYIETIPMGETTMSESELLQLVHRLERRWLVAGYNILTHNCCHFCSDLSRSLGLGRLPAWVMNLAGAGAAVVKAGDTVCCQTPSAQATLNMFCCGTLRSGRPGQSDSATEVVQVDPVEPFPVLPPMRSGAARAVGYDSQVGHDLLDKGVAYEAGGFQSGSTAALPSPSRSCSSSWPSLGGRSSCDTL